MDLKRRIRELEDLAWITESPQVGGGRVDFALIMGAVGLGIVMAQHASVVLLLLLGTAGLAWSFSGRAQLATKSWLLDLAYEWSQPAPAETAEASRVVADRDDLGIADGDSRPQIGRTRAGTRSFERKILQEAATVVSDLYRHRPIEFGAGQSGRVSELNERTRARREKWDAHIRKMDAVKAERHAVEVALCDSAVVERDAQIRKTQIAIKRQRDAIEVALRDFAVIERNQGNRLH